MPTATLQRLLVRYAEERMEVTEKQLAAAERYGLIVSHGTYSMDGYFEIMHTNRPWEIIGDVDANELLGYVFDRAFSSGYDAGSSGAYDDGFYAGMGAL